MKKILHTILLLSGIVLTSCGGSRAIYGVPAGQWERMNEAERQAAIERFNRQASINAQTRIQAEKAKQEAIELARQCHEKGNKPRSCRVKRHQQIGF